MEQVSHMKRITTSYVLDSFYILSLYTELNISICTIHKLQAQEHLKGSVRAYLPDTHVK